MLRVKQGKQTVPTFIEICINSQKDGRITYQIQITLEITDLKNWTNER